MKYNTPTTGSDDYQIMSFGNYGTTIGNVKGSSTNLTSYIGGKWNTQQCLSKATNQDQNICDGVTNNSGTGYCAPACCCVAYSTPGTKPGDWYLPMPGELYQIYANKTAINEKRTAIKGSGFIDKIYYSDYSDSIYYWSSIEHDYYKERAFSFDYGNNGLNGKCGAGNEAVLAFLSVKVPGVQS